MYRVEHTLCLINLETGEKSEQTISWEAGQLDMIQNMSGTLVMENVPSLLQSAIIEPDFKKPTKQLAAAKPATTKKSDKKASVKKEPEADAKA